MIGKQLPSSMIDPQEAILLFDFAGTEEMLRCKSLFEAYKESKTLSDPSFWESADTWDLLSVISFAYDTGRVQGIREERAKRAK